MKYYNLAPKVLCCCAKNRVLKKNIEGGFPENWWDEGDADRLVKEGFLVPVETEKQIPSVTVIVKEKESKGDAENGKKLIPYVSLKREQLMEILSLRGIEFETDANKQTLYQLYKG
jgi:hypothetical protein